MVSPDVSVLLHHGVFGSLSLGLGIAVAVTENCVAPACVIVIEPVVFAGGNLPNPSVGFTIATDVGTFMPEVELNCARNAVNVLMLSGRRLSVSGNLANATQSIMLRSRSTIFGFGMWQKPQSLSR
jgi:hypothetical protein